MDVIILAGGSGTRLWPLSREYFPKQFLKLKQLNNQSLFQLTYKRALKFSKNIIIVTNINHKFLVMGEIEELGLKISEENILVESCKKNTLPAISYAMRKVKNNALILPCDHIIEENEEFFKKIMESISENHLITFGIKPTSPNTGYGYIKHNKGIVEEYKEKPDKKKAQEYIKNNYLWNSGFFLFNKKLFEDELKKYSKEIYEFMKSDKIDYNDLPNISIDYGLLEKTDKLKVVELNIKWNDLGSFDSIYDEFEKDNNNNLSDTILVTDKSNNNLVFSDKTVALSNINNMIIVDTKDALMICKKENSQDVKELIKKIDNKDLKNYHQTVYRPWGSFTILEEGKNYKVKRLTVLSGKILSLQKHFRRSEHWVVIKGTAYVINGDKEINLKENESVYIPKENIHRLGNKTNEIVEIIETQTGDYFGEDDIIRIEDEYKRN
jgi:mannose-1-phosphate guanylyltransferase / mannose-6-phosphate isomerase